MRPLACSLVLLAGLACTAPQPPDDLDPEVIDELSAEQGSASGTTWTGTYSSTFTTESCDCPTVTLQDSSVDLCMFVEQASVDFALTQADGFLFVDVAGTMLTGAIEADGSFVVAGKQDLSSLIGPIDRLSRMDGNLEMVDGMAQFSATAGQRLIGEYLDEPIDCRWLGSVEATRLP